MHAAHLLAVDVLGPDLCHPVEVGVLDSGVERLVDRLDRRWCRRSRDLAPSTAATTRTASAFGRTRAPARTTRRPARPARSRRGWRRRCRRTGAGAVRRRRAGGPGSVSARHRSAAGSRARPSPSMPASSAQLCSAFLAKPEARVEHDLLLGARPRPATASTRAASSVAHLGHDVVVVRPRRPCRRLWPRQCITTYGTPASATTPRHLRVGQPAADVVDQRRPGRDGRLGDLGPRGVDADRHALRDQLADHRDDPAELLLAAARGRRPAGSTRRRRRRCRRPAATSSRPCAIARRRIEVAAAVGERVGGDVDHAHHQAAPGGLRGIAGHAVRASAPDRSRASTGVPAGIALASPRMIRLIASARVAAL